MVIEGEMAQESAYFGRSHVLRMLLMMEQDKTFDPVHIGIFGTDTHVFEAQHQAHLIE